MHTRNMCIYSLIHELTTFLPYIVTCNSFDIYDNLAKNYARFIFINFRLILKRRAA